MERDERQSRSEWALYGDPRNERGSYRPLPALRAIIRERGLTESEFAQLMGASKVTVSKWIAGKAYMKNRRVIAAAAILGANPCDILDVTPDLWMHRAELVSAWRRATRNNESVTDVRISDNGAEYTSLRLTASSHPPFTRWIADYEYINEWRASDLLKEELKQRIKGDYRDPARFIADMAEHIAETRDPRAAYYAWTLGDVLDAQEVTIARGKREDDEDER